MFMPQRLYMLLWQKYERGLEIIAEKHKMYCQNVLMYFESKFPLH